MSSYRRTLIVTTIFSISLITPLVASADDAFLYRFYSSEYKSHFYTINDAEKSTLLREDPNWQYEGIAAQVEAQGSQQTKPLYRFWSEDYKSHFYTTSEYEREALIDNDPNWTYEGIAYHVLDTASESAVPLYRFWSAPFRSHFYTASLAEKNFLASNDPNWTYEGIAYYSKPFSAGVGLVLLNNFESTPLGEYDNDQFTDDPSWPRVVWNETGQRAAIVRTNGDQELRMTYPAGAFGTANSGGQALIDLGNDFPELYFRQSIRFEDGFDWSRGGKLPGLSSGESTWSGGNVPENGEGYSARYMWRDNGRAILYLYHVDQTRNFGDEIDLGLTFRSGVTYTLTQRIVRNSGDESNGLIEVWVSEDGGDHRKLLSKNNVRFGLGDNGFTDSLYFSTYFGGGDSSWAPDTTSYATFDDFIVTQSRFRDLP